MSFSPFLPAKLASIGRHSCSFQTSSFSVFSVLRRSSGSNDAVAFSTGKIGMQWRHGNISFLSYVGDTGVMAKTKTLSQFLSALLPFVVTLTALASLSYPSTFTWVSKELYAPALGRIMLSSCQLTILLLQSKANNNKFLCLVDHCLSLLGFLLSTFSNYSSGFSCKCFRDISNVLLLTSCVAGAQLSSYASLLSKGDVALSILLTSFTTVASVIFTPLLSRLFIGSVIPVDAIGMSKSILQVVLVPVTLGLVLNTYAKLVVISLLRPVMPFLAMVCTSLCIGNLLSINQSRILSADGLGLLLPIVTFNAVAFALGYWFSKIHALRQKEKVSRVISLCTGMQNWTLAGLLAIQFLGSSQAVPPAFGGHDTHHGTMPCLLLGQWVSNQRHSISTHTTKQWLHNRIMSNISSHTQTSEHETASRHLHYQKNFHSSQ